MFVEDTRAFVVAQRTLRLLEWCGDEEGSLINLMQESEAATFQVVLTQAPLRSVAR